MIELHRFTRSDLYELIGVEGYDEEAIRRVLRDHENGTLREWLAESTAHAIDSANGLDGRWENQDQIDALEFWGEVQGSILQRWGIDAMEAPDPEAQYPVRVMLVGDEVVAAEINTDPLGRKPYYKACFERVPGSFWGKGVPDLIADSQRVCNAAARALVDNMAVSSGPQVAVNTASLPPGEDVTQVFPWKIWQLDFNKGATSSQPPIQFFQPNPMTEQLMAVYERFSRMADDHSGIPAYTYGSGEASGAGSTASGLSMLMNAASKAIKSVISSIDKNVISRMVHSWYTYNMLYSDDDSIKGDADVVARGAMSLVAKEQVQMRRQEYLGMTANPADAVIIGPEERLSLHREIWKGLDMPIHDLPDEEELRERMAPPEQQGGPRGHPRADPAGTPGRAAAARPRRTGPGRVTGRRLAPGGVMIRPNRRVLEALASLEGNGHWEDVRNWLRECEAEAMRECRDAHDVDSLRQAQGAARTLNEQNELADQARDLIRK